MLRLTFAICLASCAALAAAPTAGAAPSCRPRHARTVARSHGTRLFMVGGGGGGEYSGPSTLYACSGSSRRPARLIHVADAQTMRITQVRFKRGYVGFDVTVSDETCWKYDPGPHCDSQSVRSYNMRNGRRRAGASGGSDALALTSNGWIAWVPPVASGAPRALLAIDSHGRRQLDTGAIDPASLRATGKTVRWTNAGQPHAARLK
jgi:hypothetical protein